MSTLAALPSDHSLVRCGLCRPRVAHLGAMPVSSMAASTVASQEHRQQSNERYTRNYGEYHLGHDCLLSGENDMVPRATVVVPGLPDAALS